MINVQVAAPIPVRNQNRGNISAADADYRRAVQNVQRIEQLIKSQVLRVDDAVHRSQRATRPSKFQD